VSLAYEFADKNMIEHKFNRTARLAGKNWVLAFCKRQNLTSHSPEKGSLGRATGFNKIQCERFHNNLASVCSEKKFPAHRKFNEDESGISTVLNRVPKVISPKGKKENRLVSDIRQTVTVVCCMSSTCIFVPPTMIFERNWMKPELFTDAQKEHCE
jgi:hypothetical protein